MVGDLFYGGVSKKHSFCANCKYRRTNLLSVGTQLRKIIFNCWNLCNWVFSTSSLRKSLMQHNQRRPITRYSGWTVESPVLGLMIQKNLPKGTELFTFLETAVNVHIQIRKKSNSQWKSFDIGTNDSLYPLTDEKKPLLWFMNHSDSPNCKLKLFELEFESETVSVSSIYIPKITMMKNIKKDKELTYDYGKISHFAYTFTTPLLHLWYIFTTLLLHFYYTFAELYIHFYYTFTTLLLHFYYTYTFAASSQVCLFQSNKRTLSWNRLISLDLEPYIYLLTLSAFW